MLGTLWTFIVLKREYAWLLELSLFTAAWLILRLDTGRTHKWYSILLEGLFLLAAMSAGFLLCVALVYPDHSLTLRWGVLHGVISFFYLRCFSTYRKKTRLLLWIALYTCSLCIMSMAGHSSIVVMEWADSILLMGLARGAVYLLIPFAALYMRRFNFDDYRSVPDSGLRMIGTGLFCVLLLYLVEDRFMSSGYHFSAALLAGYLGMFIMTCSAIQSLHALCKEQNAFLELQAEKQRFIADREMTQMAESKLEDLRCIRHDLKNQYSYMQILLTEKRYEELEQYFTNLSENLPSQLNVIDCGNHTMNTVLNMLLEKLKSERIIFEHRLAVPPVLPFPDDDICAIVTNLMDNAAEECRRMLKKGWNEVTVRLEIYPHQSYLYIMCSNSTDRTELRRSKGGLRTTKDDEQMHGYGTRIISKLAEKHNGCADFFLTEGQFIAKVMLDMTEGNIHEN